MADPSPDAIAVLQLLKDEHNVLISGAPGTGKTRLLAEVARTFEWKPTAAQVPGYQPGAAVLIPARQGQDKPWLPAPDRQRKVFPTVFDQKTKYRDFVRGLVPRVTPEADQAGVRFRVSNGTLYRASEHARTPDGASLVVIDEINRGPAVQVFGDTIVAIEPDKRLGPDGKYREGTQEFELMDDAGEVRLYALPHHLYLLAAMNQADTSVEPLDVAFQRRWAPYRLLPRGDILVAHFGIGTADGDLPDEPTSAADVYRVIIRAWLEVNRRITIGRGKDFQLGHGVFMLDEPPPPDGPAAEGLAYVRRGWGKLRAHVDEVFFGDTRAIAAVLNISKNPKHPYKLNTHVFADEQMLELVEPDLDDAEFYKLLREVAQQ
jgi:5-methylcytosine-specific restriction protein B